MADAGPRPGTVERHDRRWAWRGAELAARLRVALGPLALRVEHLGTDAVAGKPVYDLQVSVRDLAEAATAFDRPLAELGLARTPSTGEADRMPPGRLDLPRRWAKRLWSRHTGAERITVHARVAGAPNERLALLLRDWFRAHPAAAPADLHDAALDLIVVTAEAWADRTGWTP